MGNVILGIIGFLAIVALVAAGAYISWRMAKGHAKLQASRAEVQHKHYWSPWEDHEVALYDEGTLVRYAPGQLRTCLDPECGVEDVRYIGGQVTSGEKDL